MTAIYEPFSAPPRSPRRDVLVQIPMTREERALLRSLAEREGVSLSQYVRSAVAERMAAGEAD